MNYFDAKFFHFMMIIIFLSNLFICIYSKHFFAKIFLGINSLFLLISGFTLLNRLGIGLVDLSSYPIWLWVKIFVWVVLAIIPPIMLKRAPKLIQKSSLAFVFLMIFASFLGIYKI